MKKLLAALLLFFPALFAAAQSSSTQKYDPRWSEQKANGWYAQRPWLVGSDYINRGAINQLEMCQADTFNPQQIDQELGWAQAIGMNTMRVFLHDLLWKQDPEGFKNRINIFLTIAAKHHIRPIFVLFDSCWDPNPKLGPQHPPIPGVHNSGWVQSPQRAALADPAQYPRLEAYVQGVIAAFANDNRILAWDLWNEPHNNADVSYAKEERTTKHDYVAELLPQVFAWARAANPSQPLTSGVFEGDWSSLAKMDTISRIQIENSDVISFHNYGWPEDFEHHVAWLEQYHRPLICTEYMARGAGSTFDTILPIAQKDRVAAINWGFVNGKTQTNLPWDSWTRPYVLQQPTIWFHDIFYPDGKPYRQREIEIIRTLTTQSNGAPKP
ncbi:MAG: cellulase family glycosylhydrolase [Silvibacterium sp.]